MRVSSPIISFRILHVLENFFRLVPFTTNIDNIRDMHVALEYAQEVKYMHKDMLYDVAIDNLI